MGSCSPGSVYRDQPELWIVRFYNGRGTAEQWIKEGKYELDPGHKFVANQVRLALFVLAYNLSNFLRRLVLSRNTGTSLIIRLILVGGWYSNAAMKCW